MGLLPTVVQQISFRNLHSRQRNKSTSSDTLWLTVVLFSSTCLVPLKFGVKVTILDVEYTGRRYSFPAHTVLTSFSPVKVEKKVSNPFRYDLWERHVMKCGIWLTKRGPSCGESRIKTWLTYTEVSLRNSLYHFLMQITINVFIGYTVITVL